MNITPQIVYRINLNEKPYKKYHTAEILEIFIKYSSEGISSLELILYVRKKNFKVDLLDRIQLFDNSPEYLPPNIKFNWQKIKLLSAVFPFMNDSKDYLYDALVELAKGGFIDSLQKYTPNLWRELTYDYTKGE